MAVMSLNKELKVAFGMQGPGLVLFAVFRWFGSTVGISTNHGPPEPRSTLTHFT
jgi:hypothetical protein